MKLHRVLLSGVFMSLYLAPALADEIRSELDLAEVTVNPRGAQLMRTGDVDLPAGTHEVVLDTLPQGILPASVQVDGVSSGDVEIGTVDVSRIALDPELQASGKRRSLQDELEALARDRARHERVRIDAEFRRATLERLTSGQGAAPFAGGERPATERVNDFETVGF